MIEKTLPVQPLNEQTNITQKWDSFLYQHSFFHSCISLFLKCKLKKGLIGRRLNRSLS